MFILYDMNKKDVAGVCYFDLIVCVFVCVTR